MAASQNPRPVTQDDFGPSLYDYDPELREMAVEIANELLAERPGVPRPQILQTALQRARRWWLDRAG